MQNINRNIYNNLFKDIELPPFDIFLTGGYVRDAILGVDSKDIDIACEVKSFNQLLNWVEKTHNDVYLQCPEYLTIRALYSRGDARDYVACRKDGEYSDQRHPDYVEFGNIYDDLSRRDFTIGAMAINVKTGELLDPHNGLRDLKDRRLRTVGRAEDRFMEDPLRLIRAVRFSITKGLVPVEEVAACLQNDDWAKQLKTVSVERVREELQKCFKYNTFLTISFLNEMLSAEMLCVIFDDMGLWLLPTNKKR